MSIQLVELIERWPTSLVERIVENDWVLVVGAGISKGATNGESSPASWHGLIEGLIKTFTSGGEQTRASELLAAGQYLEVAELVRQSAVSRGKNIDFDKMVRNATDGPPAKQFQASDLQRQIIRDLAPRVIVTTNYDRLIERASDGGYNVHRPGDVNVGSDIRQGVPALIKPHGTVDDLSNIVLTRSDYATIRHRAPDLYRALEAIFLTKTALFVGYSFQDPDITLLLENSFGSARHGGAHYWLAPSSGPTHLRRLFREHYGVQMIDYDPSDNHAEMTKMLEALCLSVTSIGSRP